MAAIRNMSWRAKKQVGRGDERRHRNREDMKGAGRKKVQGGTNGKRDGDRMSRKKRGVIGGRKRERGKKGLVTFFLELLK